jgi:hypothetical protein
VLTFGEELHLGSCLLAGSALHDTSLAMRGSSRDRSLAGRWDHARVAQQYAPIT